MAEPKTPTEIQARIDRIDELIQEYMELPEEGVNGQQSWKYGKDWLKNRRNEQDRLRRQLATVNNGGIPLRTRRGCGGGCD